MDSHGRRGHGFTILKQQGIKELVMAGRVRRPSLLDSAPGSARHEIFRQAGRKGFGDDKLAARRYR